MMKGFLLTSLCVFSFMANAQVEQVCNERIPASTPTENFQILEDGTVIDTTTDLMWSRCNVGQQYVEGDCVGVSDPLYWTEALDAAENSTFAGYADWRVPNYKEVLSLLENSCAYPSINEEVFPNTGSNALWSSTPAVGQTGIWFVYTHGGESWFDPPDYEPYNVKLVRDAQ